jgi:hypothetical protein
MKLKYNDAYKAAMWPKEHRDVAVFAVLVLGFLTVVLVDLHVMSVRAATAAFVASVVYVAITTWQFTHSKQKPPGGPQEPAERGTE